MDPVAVRNGRDATTAATAETAATAGQEAGAEARKRKEAGATVGMMPIAGETHLTSDHVLVATILRRIADDVHEAEVVQEWTLDLVSNSQLLAARTPIRV